MSGHDGYKNLLAEILKAIERSQRRSSNYLPTKDSWITEMRLRLNHGGDGLADRIFRLKS
jgi:hypothetical protein